MNFKNKKSNEKKTRGRLFLRMLLYVATILFILWLFLVLFLHFLYDQDEIKENSLIMKADSLTDLKVKELEILPVFNEEKGSTDKPSTEKDENEMHLGAKNRDEFQPAMKDLLKERELLFKNAEELFENVKFPKDINRSHSTMGKDVIYIYHTHSRESFLPYLKNIDRPEDAFHPQVNITSVGKMLERALERRGVGTKADSIDIVQKLEEKGLEYGSSYLISRERVRAAKKANKKLDIFLDIHRDSLRKSSTTTEKNGEKFARLLFVVGTGHKDFEKNLSFTKELHQQISIQHPGLSKGILTKDSSQGNGVYNQDVAPHSVIVEVGGVDNTAEEISRAIEVLADALSNYYWHGKK